MECTATYKEIKETFLNVRKFSYDEKRHTPIAEELTEDQRNNIFLDAILELKSKLKVKTDSVNDITERIEKLTWFDNLDEECLMLLNDLISTAKDLHSSLVKHYILFSEIRKKGIAKEELKQFKSSIDCLKEAWEDLESVFFYLPNNSDFIETTRQISLL